MMIMLICLISTQMTGNGQMDIKLMENEAKIRANVLQYRDRQALFSNESIRRYGKSHGHWLKGFNHALLLIIGRLG